MLLQIKYYTLIIALISSSFVLGKEKHTFMLSTKKSISMIIDGGFNDWIITPDLNPDILELYDATKKKINIRFISDIDSLSFNIKANNRMKFGIILNQKDTGWVEIKFTNKIAATLTEKDKIYALSYFWSEAKYNFAFIDKLNFDFDSLYQAFIPKILSTENDYEFYDQMKIFSSSLKDLHTEIYYKDRNIYSDYIPIGARYFGDTLKIINVRKNLSQRIPIGSNILKINGLGISEYLRTYVEPYINSDFEPTVRRLSAYRLFASDLSSKKMTITYQTPDKLVQTITLSRDGNRKNDNEYVGYSPNYPKQPIELSWVKGKIAHLSFNTFYPSDELIPQFERLVDTLYKAKAIIIDIRKNSGGSTATAKNLLNYIIKDEYYLDFGYQTRINEGVKKATGNFIEDYENFYREQAFQTYPADTVWIPDSIYCFNSPIAILIGENTCSAAEDFLIMLKERKDRPVFIGSPTLGSTGSPLVLDRFPESGMARICTRRVTFPYSQKPFTEGIVPDILIDYTFDEFLDTNLDKELEAAIEYLITKIE